MTTEHITMEALEGALRADVPEPDAAFAERLGARVREGFPRRRLPRPRTLAFAGAAASLLVAVGVAVSKRSRLKLHEPINPWGVSWRASERSNFAGPAPSAAT